VPGIPGFGPAGSGLPEAGLAGPPVGNGAAKKLGCSKQPVVEAQANAIAFTAGMS
jgi:hypothetical protein